MGCGPHCAHQRAPRGHSGDADLRVPVAQALLGGLCFRWALLGGLCSIGNSALQKRGNLSWIIAPETTPVSYPKSIPPMHAKATCQMHARWLISRRFRLPLTMMNKNDRDPLISVSDGALAICPLRQSLVRSKKGEARCGFSRVVSAGRFDKSPDAAWQIRRRRGRPQ